MSLNYENSTEAFSKYLQSMVKLEELQKMTEDLDKELEDSQRVMDEMKTLYYSIPNAQNNRPEQNNGLKRENLSQFLGAEAPKLLMNGMPEYKVEFDIDKVIAAMKCYTEDLRKKLGKCRLPEPQQMQAQKNIENVDLEQYATSLDQLVNRLARIKLIKNSEENRNAELEAKLRELCNDVNMFTQLLKARTKLGKTKNNWTHVEQSSTALQYDNLINKLLIGINEVTYLLHNKN